MQNELRHLRKNKGLTQSDIAREMGMSVSAVSQIERGEVEITVSNILRLASIIGCLPCEICPPLSRFQLNAEEFRMVEILRDLPGTDRAFIYDYVKNLHGTRMQHKGPDNPPHQARV